LPVQPRDMAESERFVQRVTDLFVQGERLLGAS
jgi:hypothetical protein